jgi:transposase
MQELVLRLREQTGISVSVPTMYKALRNAGIKRTRAGGANGTVAQGPTDSIPPARSYGYSALHRDSGDAQRYPSSLTDHEWKLVADIFENSGGRGRPARYPRREILDACCYVLRSGCAWRMLPKEFPHWDDVYKTFRRWAAAGKFEQMHDRLRAAWRQREQRESQPTAGVVDSQSVKTSQQGGPKGFDAGKKVKGRKRHLIVDTLGLLLAVMITPANVQDRDAAPDLVKFALQKYASLKKVFVDSAYAGRCAHEIREKHSVEVEVVRRGNPAVGRWHEGQMPLFPMAKGFVVLPKRWVVERTNAWNDRPRRMSKDHDRRLDVAVAWIWLTEARLLVRRIAYEPVAAAA